MALTGRVTFLRSGACALGLPAEMYDAWAAPMREQAANGDMTALRDRLQQPPAGLPALEEMTDLAALAAFLHGNPWGTSPDDPRATGAGIVAYPGEDDPTLDWGKLRAEQAGATFFTVPGGIRDSMVNADPVLAAVQHCFRSDA